MLPPKVDYNALAATYNQRYAVSTMPGTHQALLSALKPLQPGRILEVGCGTGYWLEQLTLAGHRVWGLDYSRGMLQEATQRPPAVGRLTQADAVVLPYAPDLFDAIVCVNALHHFSDQAQFFVAARRVLRPGGTLYIATMQPRDARWYAYDYFAGLREKDMARFHAWEQLTAWMHAAGFTQLARTTVEELGQTFWGEDVLQDPFLPKHNSSQMAMLSDTDYEAGVANIRQAIATAAQTGQRLEFPNRIPMTLLTGVVPLV